MIKIRLFCGAGMSTSLLARKIADAATEAGVEAEVIAYPVSTIKQSSPAQLAEMADVALLGPQVAFEKGQLAPKFAEADVPFEVIPMRDYGLVDGKAVFQLAMRLIEEHGTK